MNYIKERNHLLHELDDDDKSHITDLFFKDVVSKLKKLDARQGTLSCGFAGGKYINWTLRFKSVGSDFDIVDFEYDEEGTVLDLDL
jgi:hypothetical protein